jgi:ParB/RepB/Spo0J family partition protein
MSTAAAAAVASIPPRFLLTAITPSKTNPRKYFDPVALNELAETIKTNDVLEPILLRPNGKPGSYEIVAGERRWRAAKIAGKTDIPAIVRELSDEQALEIQVIENLARKDLRPLEEATGYEQLMNCDRAGGKQHYSADEIATKVGKSRAYVYAKLKLLALASEARKALEEQKISESIALLIARIPGGDLQKKALEEIAPAKRPDQAMTYREAAKFVQERFMLRLGDAPFDVKKIYFVDKGTTPIGPLCGECPSRTGNQADLFSDVKSADVCTDPKCFDAKRQAHYATAAAELVAKGKKVLHGDDAKKAFPGWDSPNDWQRSQLSDRYTPLSGHTYDPKTYRNIPVRQLLGDDYEPVVVQHPTTGKLTECATQQAVQAALQKTGKQKKAAAKAAAAKPKQPDVDDVLTARLAKLVYEKAPKQFGKAWFLALAKELVEHLSTRDLDAVALAWGWKASAFRSGSYGPRKLPAEASKLSERDLMLLMFHFVFAIGPYTRQPVLKLFGINEQQTREKILEERKAAAKKAREEAKAAAEKKAAPSTGKGLAALGIGKKKIAAKKAKKKATRSAK